MTILIVCAQIGLGMCIIALGLCALSLAIFCCINTYDWVKDKFKG